MASTRKVLVLLDGNALIHRAYHALPPLTTKGGEVVHAAYGFTMTLLSVLEKFKPDYIAASFDLEGPTFRDELYEDYKATRVAAPDDLYAQIPRVKEIVTAFNIPIYEKEGYEADDCVGTLARQGAEQDVDVIIVTGDNDTLQLVTERVKVFTLRKGLKDMVLLGPPEVEAKYGFKPEFLVDFKGLRGDASDNIPGVKGIGDKTATDLILEFGTLERVYANLKGVKPKIREKLEADKKTALLSKKLGTIDTHAPVTLDLSACVAHDFDRAKVEALFRELGFFSLLKRLPGGESKPETRYSPPATRTSKLNTRRITDKKEAETLLKTLPDPVAVVIEEKEASLFGGGIEAVALAAGNAVAIIAWNEETIPVLKDFFRDEAKRKVFHDAKRAMHVLAQSEVVVVGVSADTMLMAYLLRPGSKVDFETLVLEKLGEEAAKVSAEKKALILSRLFATLDEEIQQIEKEQRAGKTLRTVLETIELPLVPFLFAMEERGIVLDKKRFASLSVELEERIGALEKKVMTLSGRDFNLNSPKQLADILFGDLKIPTDNIKKNKTSYSTASTELQKLRADYPIVELIERYRELFKLKTTYVDTLPTLVAKDGRLHTTFHQAVAATGRLSSADPNLQNIPIRTEWGERLRLAFRAAPGHVFVGADYSQIELRIVAHLSRDKNMLAAFERGEDIHRATAAIVNGLSPDAVTDRMRREAKVLNFGIIYGMGTFGLSQAAQIDQKEAAEFIKNYLKKFSGVARYMEAMRRQVRETGYVETELGRRRYLPEIESGNRVLVAAAERMAINMPVQGLAADIVKLAMLASRPLLEQYRDQVHLLLQIHDELIFEVAEDRAEAFARDLKPVMENVYALSVPLLVSISIGQNWGEI